jgi:hypothetical protein
VHDAGLWLRQISWMLSKTRKSGEAGLVHFDIDELNADVNEEASMRRFFDVLHALN